MNRFTQLRQFAGFVLALVFGVTALSLPLSVQAHKVTIPPEFADLRNPLTATPENKLIGKQIYQTHCETCHGRAGKGDGPLGAVSRPPDLDHAIKFMPDGYFFWRVARGEGNMPAFESVLTERQRWLAIAYLRTLPEGAAGRPPTGEPEAAAPVRAPAIHIYAPEQGETVEGDQVQVRIHLLNFSALDGQVRYSLDGGPEQVGGISSYIFNGVKPGPHTVMGRLADREGRPLNPDVAHSVPFSVKRAPIPARSLIVGGVMGTAALVLAAVLARRLTGRKP